MGPDRWTVHPSCTIRGVGHFGLILNPTLHPYCLHDHIHDKQRVYEALLQVSLCDLRADLRTGDQQHIL